MNNSKVIVEALKSKNDEKGFKLLYKYYYPTVKRLIIGKYSGNAMDVDDVFQDVVMILMREIEHDRMDDTKNFDNYIYTIAKNLWLNKLKKENKNISFDDLNLDKTMTTDVDYHTRIKESEDLINQILKQLGDRCETILKAIIFDNKKQEDIAIELGLSDRHVIKTYKNRCKAKLIELLNSNTTLRLALLQNDKRYEQYLNINF